MKQYLLCALALGSMVGSVTAQTKKPATQPVKAAIKPAAGNAMMKNAVDSFSYAAGVNIASSMKEQGITQMNAACLSKAIDDVLKSRPTLLTSEQANMTLQQQLQAYAAKKSEAAKAEGNKFLAENKKRPGVTTLPNGLQYEVIKASTDPVKPTAQDTVVVHYVGKLTNGTEFDNSVSRGEPATFPVGGVIRGWTEILQLMPKGSEWKVYIPSDLAYGDRGAGGSIPPGAALVFDINLIDVKPAVKQ